MQEKGFVALRHNELRDNIVEILQVTSNIKVEPALQPLPGGEIKGDLSGEARSYISARWFCIRGQRAFFGIRLFDPNAQGHQSKTLRKCYEINEQEKKREKFWTLNKYLSPCFQQLEEWEENVRCFLKNFVNLFP